MSGQHTVMPHRVRAIAVTGMRLTGRIVLVVPLRLPAHLPGALQVEFRG